MNEEDSVPNKTRRDQSDTASKCSCRVSWQSSEMLYIEGIVAKERNYWTGNVRLLPAKQTDKLTERQADRWNVSWVPDQSLSGPSPSECAWLSSGAQQGQYRQAVRPRHRHWSMGRPGVPAQSMVRPQSALVSSRKRHDLQQR